MASIRSILSLPHRKLIRPFKWWRWLAMLWLLILIAGLGYLAPSFRPNLLLILVVGGFGGIVLIWLLLQWPALGLVLLIPSSMVVKFALGTGTQTELNVTVLLLVLMLGLWLFGMVEKYGTLRLYKSRTTLPLILFLVVAVLAFLNGQLMWFNVPGASLAAQIGGLMVMILSAESFYC